MDSPAAFAPRAGRRLAPVLALALLGAGLAVPAGAAPKQDPAASQAAFLKAYPVFLHPRCVNCHPSGDVPLQGEHGELHTQGVRRGPAGHGTVALRCSACHQHANLPGPHLPPGSKLWALPPPQMRMVFEGRTPAQLARQLLDPAQNGHRTPAQLIEHVEHEALVLVCWEPNTNGRPLPPLSHEEFARAVRDWIELGAAIPNG